MADQILPLQLFALGPPEVRLGENLLTFPTRKTLALLIYLAIEAGSQPREHLATLLWPEASPSAAMPRCATPSAICKPPCARQAVRLKPPIFPSRTRRWA